MNLKLIGLTFSRIRRYHRSLTFLLPLLYHKNRHALRATSVWRLFILANCRREPRGEAISRSGCASAGATPAHSCRATSDLETILARLQRQCAVRQKSAALAISNQGHPVARGGMDLPRADGIKTIPLPCSAAGADDLASGCTGLSSDVILRRFPGDLPSTMHLKHKNRTKK